MQIGVILMVPLLDELVEVFGVELELTVVGPLVDLETTVGPDDEMEVLVDVGVELCELELLELFGVVNTALVELEEVVVVIGVDDEEAVLLPTKTGVGEELCELEAELLPV